MIFLDTNVVSELIRPRLLRHPNVTAFLNSQLLESFFLPSIVVAEVRYGIEAMPLGKRRVEITEQFEAFLASGFSLRITSFDAVSASCYAFARVTRRRMGRPVQVQDALIGGMALAYGATLATRNIDDFDGYNVNLINPWAAMP